MGIQRRIVTGRCLSSAFLTALLTTSAVQAAGQDRLPLEPGPIVRSLSREAARLEAEGAFQANRPEQDRRPVIKSSWAPVRALRPGTQILLTTAGSLSGERYVLNADESGLTLLNLTDPAIPEEARVTLAAAARSHHEYFVPAQPALTHRLSEQVSLGPNGVFVGRRKILTLEDIVERVERERVVEIREMHPGAVSQGMAWGMLGGGAVGVVQMLAKCGTNWKQETSSCGNLAGAGLVIFPLWGLGLGALYGASNTPTSIYAPTPSVPAASAPVSVPAAPARAPEVPAPISSLADLASRVRPGDSISVHTSNGEDVVGTFARSPDALLTIDTEDQRHVIPFDDVRQVALLQGGNRLRRGLLLGTSIGAGWGALSCASSPTVSCPQLLVGGTAGGVLLGALIGARQHGSQPIVVYPAPAAPTVRVTPAWGPGLVGVIGSVQF